MEKRFVLRKNKVEQLCLLQKVSKKDISDLLNITQSTFSCKLTGKASCSYDEIYAISNLFDVPFQDIALYSVNVSNAELEKASSLMKHSVIDKELFDSLLKKEGLKKTSFAKQIVTSSFTSSLLWVLMSKNLIESITSSKNSILKGLG